MEEIFKLRGLLEDANIPFEWKPIYDGYQIIIKSMHNGERLCDAIEHSFSYGNERDMLEIMGGLTIEEQMESSVLGWITAEEVRDRFVYCFKHNTSTYDGGKNEN